MTRSSLLPSPGTGTFWLQLNHPRPEIVSEETQAVGQKVACGNESTTGPTGSHPAAQCLQPKPSSEVLLERRTAGSDRDMMLPVTHMLAFSAWLVAQSKATPSAPTVSIFLKPPGVIPPGGSTTICCSCQCDNGKFVLYRKGNPHLELRGSRAEFPISNATTEDAGAYSCHYMDGDTVLARSEILDVMVQEFSLPTPVLSVLPGQEVAAGAYVIFRCTIAHSSASCFLYLEGQVKTPELLYKDRDDFNLSHVHKGNGGRYSCQCFTKGSLLKWSAVSNALDLVVRDYTWNNAVRLALGAALLLLLGLFVADAVRGPAGPGRGSARPLRDRGPSALRARAERDP